MPQTANQKSSERDVIKELIQLINSKAEQERLTLWLRQAVVEDPEFFTWFGILLRLDTSGLLNLLRITHPDLYSMITDPVKARDQLDRLKREFEILRRGSKMEPQVMVQMIDCGNTIINPLSISAIQFVGEEVNDPECVLVFVVGGVVRLEGEDAERFKQWYNDVTGKSQIVKPSMIPPNLS
jgi:hypothetical protein